MTRVVVDVVPIPGHEELPLPAYKTEGAAGMDLLSSVDMEVAPGEFKLVPTGIRIAIPSGYEGQVRPRSGFASKKGVTVLNTPGTIDSDYRGEVKVCLINHGSEPFRVEREMRIAQLVIAPVARAEWRVCGHLPWSERGDGGFQSTGTK